MTEDRLKDLFRRTRPEPDRLAKARAIEAAMAAFEAESETARQGEAIGRRQTVRQSGLIGRLGSLMNALRMKPLLVGGTSVAAIAVALLVVRDTGYRQHIGEPLVRLTVGGSEAQKGDGTVAPAEEAEALVDATAPAPDARANQSRMVMTRELGAEVRARRAYSPDTRPSRRVEKRFAANDTHGMDRSAAMVTEERAQLYRAAPAPAAEMEGDAAGRAHMAPPVIVPPHDPPQPGQYSEQGRDRFPELETNPPKITAEAPVSTFSIDVDTASYAFARKAILQGALPPPDAVRVEEMINYFAYDYAPPEDPETPFATHLEVTATPWNPDTKLLRIGIQGYELPADERPQANLVFLIDSSGSMQSPDKLPLLLNSFRLLLDELAPDDTVSIVTYAGSAGTVLEPTRAAEKQKILAALGQLHAGGSTAGAEGIRQAYQLAEQAFIDGGVNRVILATDGDFNVGITDPEELKGFVERKRASGVSLSVLGFGQGNYNDRLMQVLAQNGNGNAAYIDTLSEARKTLVEEAGSTLFTIAKDVKIQIEFNPATIAEYRLIGYETRMLAREDFNNDRIDAGEIGSGHRVTALYELTPVGSAAALVDPLRYGSGAAAEAEAEVETEATTPAPAHPASDEFGFLKIRYKAPDGDVSKLISRPFGPADETASPGTETRFAAAVAAFGQLLRGGTYLGGYTFEEAAALAQGAKGDDPFGYRAEFVNLVRLAESASAMQPLRR